MAEKISITLVFSLYDAYRTLPRYLKMSSKKMICRQQITAARGLLSWTKSKLSEESGVSERTITRFELGEGDITVSKLDKLELALVAQGIEFIDGGVLCEALKRGR